MPPRGGTPLYWTGNKGGMEDIIKGEQVLYYFGRVQYRDIFNRKRETRYCYPPLSSDCGQYRSSRGVLFGGTIRIQQDDLALR
jgi:hypothetical protein